MDVFELRDRLVRDYGEYTRSFLEIQEESTRAWLDQTLDDGLLWPEPLVQLNPSFASGGWVDELVSTGLLHESCRRIFRRKDVDPATGTVPIDSSSGLPGAPLRLHRHQVEAIEVAQTGKPYVLTTGTGSGKSLAYIVPIVDHIVRNGSGKGVQAIVVYPMNALANSQEGELHKFLNLGYPDTKGPVTFRRYTGQESEQQRSDIIATPPDILLTNYVMLELMLTRPRDRQLIAAAKGLRFLVLDELHTYRGRQGADVALLLRRVREATQATHLQYIGTSATLAGGGTFDEQRAEVASVASTLFGALVEPTSIIGETLLRATPEPQPGDGAWVSRLRQDVEALSRSGAPADHRDVFLSRPLTAWVESALGVTGETDSGRLRRQMPRSIGAASQRLSELTGATPEACRQAIRRTLDVGRDVRLDGSPFPVFPYRLHQFFDRGDAVFASLDPRGERYLTTQGQQFVPGDRDRILLPLSFCRECGQDYYNVTVSGPKGSRSLDPRDLQSAIDDDDTDEGYLYLDPDSRWADVDQAIAAGLVPEDWLESGPGDTLRVKSSQRRYLPEPVHIAPDGQEGGDDALQGYLIVGTFRLCLRCGVYYAGRQSEAGKLSSLGTGGRSSATSLLSLSTIKALRALPPDELDPSARKLLSFTDNRQDASLQAGHFNDFVEVGTLRAALRRAVEKAGPAGLRHDELSATVVEALSLDPDFYAQNPQARYGAALEAREQAMRDVVGYRLYVDLRRGWRVQSPNLEQCGLLEIRYRSIDELAADDQAWERRHPGLAKASVDQRTTLARTLLDFMRRELAIQTDYLRSTWQEGMKARSRQQLISPWMLDEQERPFAAAAALPRSSGSRVEPGERVVYISPRGGFGQFLRRSTTLGDFGKPLRVADTEVVIIDLLEVLREADLVSIAFEGKERRDTGYQVKADAMLWLAGDGLAASHDPIRVPHPPVGGLRPNKFFQRFYREIAMDVSGITAREHTAQVTSEDREDRERDFRSGVLPILYCSPTMELGVDIADLNVVNMRNVPPTPANYAQRSGRAGRSGRPALVFTYCTTGSPHDQYFFRRPERMVSGQVRPPRLDVLNEDLVRAHVHAIWLAETHASLGSSLSDVLDLAEPHKGFPIKPSLQLDLADELARKRAEKSAAVVVSHLPGIEDAEWYSPSWLSMILGSAYQAFDRACDRWRDLYRSALETQEVHNKAVLEPYRSAQDKQRSSMLRDEAEQQLRILTGSGGRDRVDSDFYTYRYFASEGFLPGYSFPRLPVSAYIPGRSGMTRKSEYLSRPRFLAISEFGPRAIVYHEGSRYIINRVIMPASARGQDNMLVTQSTKRCQRCGYLHDVHANDPGPDLCVHCAAPLPTVSRELFRMTNVATKRRDRINSDEEERQRQGYELVTGVRFDAQGSGRERTADATLGDGSAFASLSYGAAATIWRMNIGWRRRQNKEQRGFLIDVEGGYWEKKQDDPTDQEDPMGKLKQRVIPYVSDRRNSLLFQPKWPTPDASLARTELASLGAALKRAIELRYQLEDHEIAVEPLPDERTRNLLLFYEAAEGGAGVLGQIVRDPLALGELARVALEVCHFDATSGDDEHHAPGAKEDCEAACYDCLMSYANQRDHRFLDRQAIKGILTRLMSASVTPSGSYLSREEHVTQLERAAESTLERSWLEAVDRRGLNPPSRSQVFVEACMARPDFVYDDYSVAVFVDGPVHGLPDVSERDEAAQRRLEDAGWYVLRFGVDSSGWDAVFGANPAIFGTP